MSKLAVICIFGVKNVFFLNNENLEFKRIQAPLFVSAIFWYFEIWLLTFISDWQIYKMAGSKSFRGVVDKSKCSKNKRNITFQSKAS